MPDSRAGLPPSEPGQGSKGLTVPVSLVLYVSIALVVNGDYRVLGL